MCEEKIEMMQNHVEIGLAIIDILPREWQIEVMMTVKVEPDVRL